MMNNMALARRRYGRSWRVSSLLLFTLFSSFSAPAAPSTGRWDTAGAERDFQEAARLKDEISRSAAPELKQYLRCAGTYRNVYLKDPHYVRAADAIYEEGRIYQEMGAKFSDPEFYKTAAKRFDFLVRDYGGNSNCPDALARLVDLYSNYLDDSKAAAEAYRRLKSRYGRSDAFRRLESSKAASGPAETPAPPPVVQADNAPMLRGATIHSVRYWSTEDYTRVLIDMDSEARYRKVLLSDPERIYFDIFDSRLSADLRARTFAVEDDLLKRIRVAQNSPDVVRVVLDLASKDNPSVFELHDPFRIVIDLHRRSAKGAEAQSLPVGAKPRPDETAPAPVSARAPEPPSLPKTASPTSAGNRTLTRVLGLKVGRVVIDPGHGGHDLGCVGPGGLLEKDLVLAIALKLQKLLEENLAAEVFLTRTDDSFVSLEERTAIANRHHADLFISIHANSSRSRSASGAETYYLDFATTDAEREVAARENATALNNFRDLEDLIKKIAQADKSMESRELASIVQKRLYAGIRNIFPSTKNRGVRRAPFIVLIGANMPSVLTEIAFISNPGDERLLRKTVHQERMASALFAGIQDYIKTLGTDVAQNRQIQNK